MRVEIRHRTTYDYDEPVPYGLQQLRLTPRSGASQKVVEWQTHVEGGKLQLEFEDHHANLVSLIGVDLNSIHIEVVSEGIVETLDTAGVIRQHDGFAPLWLFRRSTLLTGARDRVESLANGLDGADPGSEDLARLHELARRIGETVDYVQGSTDSDFTAEEVLEAGSGVCQDHAHVFISSARHLGFPARYVSGYLFMDEQAEQAASHAWSEAWVDHLGWVGFDVSNGISPDERYVRVATGLDYHDAAPVSGLRFGGGDERLDVTLHIQAQQ